MESSSEHGSPALSIATSVEQTPCAATPLNPKKRKAPANNEDDTPEAAAHKIVKAPKRTRARTAGGTKKARAIGRNYEECDEADKMLIDWCNAGKEWAEIREEWGRITGETNTKTSTLPNRYQRLMNNMAMVKDEDKAKLIAFKQQIEKEWEEEKWKKISVELAKDGGLTYEPGVLQRAYRNIILQAENLPPIVTID